MRVLSWNVEGAFPVQGSKDQIRSQVEYIGASADSPDILMLNEVNAAQRDYWRELLREELGYTEIVDTLDWAQELRESDVPPHQDIGHSNGNLTAVHEDAPVSGLTRHQHTITEGEWEHSDEKHWSTNFPEKILTGTVNIEDTTLGLWNVRTVPGSMYGEEKIKILENVYHRIQASEQDQCILAGDFNAPKAELPDGTVVPWGYEKADGIRERWFTAELNVLDRLTNQGMVDAFRSVHGYGDIQIQDVSFQSKRFDHLLASEGLKPVGCEYDSKGLEESDHAPIVGTFTVS
jgi:exonuclease III